MTGMSVTSDEELRAKQIRALRRQWLRDQELSPREPVEVPGSRGPVERFWQRFLTPQSVWRLYVSSFIRLGEVRKSFPYLKEEPEPESN
uniref:NADH dehydrogenase [ubiquinone] 1 beta subcomplex subunit 6 n=1 Tax=Eptatretus burgeri TaxID=7764 RepID=A0A8C4WVV7_EPTBU